MQAKDSYSSEEILAALRASGLDEVAVVEEAVSGDEGLLQINCVKGDLGVRCYPEGVEPFFSAFQLVTSIYSTLPDPFRFANELNSESMAVKTEVAVDDSGQVIRNGDGDAMLMMSALISFEGGVTPEHVQIMTAFCVGELLEVLGLDEPFPESNQIQGGVDDVIKEMGIAGQISWVLGSDSIPRTSRQLATFLMKKKPEINSALYRNPDLFRKDGSQPPRWSLHR